MRRCSIIPTLLALSLGCRAPATPPTPDDGLGEILRTAVIDSLVAAGRRPGQTYAPANAESDTLLRAAGLAVAPLANDARPLCPGSTVASGGPVTGDVGYVVRAHRVEQVRDVLHLAVEVSCLFIHRGDARGFAQSATWELRRASGRWRVTRTLARGIT